MSRGGGLTEITDPEQYRQKAEQDFGGFCHRCGDPLGWEDAKVHHVDRDRDNDNRDNLESLCHECHQDEHNGDDPMLGLVVSLPPPLLELLDEAVERRGYGSRSEAVARAVARAYDPKDPMADPAGSVHAWFGTDRHTKWVSDAVVRPFKEGSKNDGPRATE